MIDAISLETAHLLGDALPDAHRLRYRIFIERQGYEVPSWRAMEWDQFDTPRAVYLLWRDETARARAVARLIPTSAPYMIRELWPELVESQELPVRDDVWEVSRVGIDRNLDPACRARVLGELACAFAEFGLRCGVSEYLFVTASRVIAGAIEDAGVPAERLGGIRRLGRWPVVAARSRVTWEALGRLRRHHRVPGRVLRIAGEEAAMAA